MKYQTPGELLRSLRVQRGLSQGEVAGLVGVTQSRYNNWEREYRRVPEKDMPTLAAVLGVDAATLQPLATNRPRGRPAIPEGLARGPRRTPMLPPYKVQGRIDEMARLGGVAQDLLHAVQRRLSTDQIARLESRFPRDTTQELMCAFHVLAEGGRLCEETLQRLRCPVLAVEHWGSARSAASHARDVLLLRKGNVTMVLVPQVWVPSIVQAEWYRLDFLTLVRREDGLERWADVEIDGFHPHAANPEQDEKRARGICGAPRVGFWNREVTQPNFCERLVSRLVDLLVRPAPSFVARRPRTN